MSNKKRIRLRFLCTLASIVLMFSAVSGTFASAASAVSTNTASAQSNSASQNVIKDSNLKAAVNAALKRTSSHAVTAEDMAKLTKLDASYRNIRDTSGLEYAVNLNSLNLTRNKISNIDLSKNTALTSLSIADNQLSSVELSSNILLTNLDISKNRLNSLNLLSLTSLSELYMQDNNISELDISKNINLTYIDANNNSLSSINTDNNLSLTSLSLANNVLEHLDISKNVGLSYLDVEYNNLTGIDLSANPVLDTVISNNNEITTVKMPSHNVNYIDLSNQYIVVNDIEKVSGKVSFNNNIILNDKSLAPSEISDSGVYDLNNNKLIWQNVAGDSVSFTFDTNIDNTSTQYSSNYSGEVKLNLLELENPAQPSESVITDKNLAAVINEYLGGRPAETPITTYDLLSVKEINAKGKDIRSLQGLEYAINLNTINLDGNKIEDIRPIYGLKKLTSVTLANDYFIGQMPIDFSGAVGLEKLEIVNIPSFQILLPEKGTLTDLTINRTGLSKIDLSKQTNLVNLNLHRNMIRGYINLDANTLLENVDISSNDINSPTFMNLTKLKTLNISNTSTGLVDLTNNVNLESLIAVNAGIFGLDLSANSNLTYLEAGKNPFQNVNLSNNLKLKHIDIGFNPESPLSNANITLPITDAVEYLDVTSISIGTRLDKYLSNYSNLSTLKAGYTKALSIDVTKNTKLEELYLNNNYLENIDLSKNINLKKVYLGSNTISEIVGIEKLEKLVDLDAERNLIANIDLSNNVLLTDLNLNENHISNIDLSKNININYAYIDSQIVNIEAPYSGGRLEYPNKIAFNGKLLQVKFISQDGYYEEPNVIWDNIDPSAEFVAYLASIRLSVDDGSTTAQKISFSCQVILDLVRQPVDNVIKDDNLKAIINEKYLKRTDPTADISQLDLFELTEIIAPDANIQTISGLEYAPNLKHLDLSGNNLQEADLSLNGRLETIILNDNKITSFILNSGRATVKALNIRNNELTSLTLDTGVIVHEVDASNNKITTVGLKLGNIQLKTLLLNNNALTTLDLRQLNDLVTLVANDNPNLDKIDFSTMTYSLDHVNVSNAKLTALDLGQAPSLRELYVYNNELTALDLSLYPSLKHVFADHNNIQTIDFIYNNAIKTVSFQDNKLSTIKNFKNLSTVESLNLSNNLLADIDLSPLTSVEYLDVSYNSISKLKTISVPNIKYFNASNQNLEYTEIGQEGKATFKNPIMLNDKLLPAINISNRGKYEGEHVVWTRLSPSVTAVTYRFDDEFQLSEDNHGYYNGQVTIHLIEQQEGDVLKDNNLRSAVNDRLGRAPHTSVTKEDMESLIDTLYASERGITDTTGLEYAVNLKELYIEGNKISNINLTTLTQLEELNLSNNNISDLDLSKNTKLNSLNLSRNEKLSNINLQNCVNLEHLNISNNNIESIDVSKNTNLKWLYLPENKIKNIDVSKNINLLSLDLYHNDISDINLNSNTNLQIVELSKNKIYDLNLANLQDTEKLVLDQQVDHSVYFLPGQALTLMNQVKYNGITLIPDSISGNGIYDRNTNTITWPQGTSIEDMRYTFTNSVDPNQTVFTGTVKVVAI